MSAHPSATTLPNPRGTAFVHDTSNGHTELFNAREPGSGDIEYGPLSHELAHNYPKARANNAKALRAIALEELSEPRLTDPNARYARQVHRVLLTQMRDADRITTTELDDLTTAFDIGVEHAALAVAAAWLRERGSLPIPTEGSGA